MKVQRLGELEDRTQINLTQHHGAIYLTQVNSELAVLQTSRLYGTEGAARAAYAFNRRQWVN